MTTRAQVLEGVRCGVERTVDLARLVERTPNAVAFHLRALEREGEVARIGNSAQTRWVIRTGTRTVQWLDARRDRLDEEIRDVRKYLETLEAMRRAL